MHNIKTKILSYEKKMNNLEMPYSKRIIFPWLLIHFFVEFKAIQPLKILRYLFYFGFLDSNYYSKELYTTMNAINDSSFAVVYSPILL